MFEAKLTEGSIFKKIVESIKDLVNDVNIDISPSGKYPTSVFKLISLITTSIYNVQFLMIILSIGMSL